MDKQTAVLEDTTPSAPNQDEAEEQQAFTAAFAGVATPTEPTQPSDTAPLAEPLQTKEAAAATPTALPSQPPPPLVPEPKYAQVTDAQLNKLLATATTVDEIKAAMAKRFDDAFGRLGGFERTIKELQAATTAGEPLTVSEADFEEMKAEFPEITAMQVKAFNRILGKLQVRGTGAPAPKADAGPPQVIDPAQLEKLVNEKVQATAQSIRDETAQVVTTELRPDWVQIVGLPGPNGEQPPQTAFRQWLATQPAVYQQALNASLNPMDVVKAIEQFEKDTAKPTPPMPPDTRKPRLAAAVPPKSVPAATHGEKGEHESFVEAFGHIEA